VFVEGSAMTIPLPKEAKKETIAIKPTAA